MLAKAVTLSFFIITTKCAFKTQKRILYLWKFHLEPWFNIAWDICIPGSVSYVKKWIVDLVYYPKRWYRG